MALTTLRWLIVCALLAATIGPQIRAEAPILAPRWRWILAMATVGLTSFNALMYLAAHSTTAVNITILQGPMPIFVMIGSFLAFGTRIYLVQALGAALTIAGVVSVAARGDPATLAEFAFNIGDLFMIVAVAAYASFTVALRNRPKVSSFVFFSALASAALLVSLPLLALEIAAGAVVWPTARGWAILLYVALFPSLLSQIFFMRGVELIGPGRAGLFVNLTPVFGALLAVVVLGEPFALYHAAALALVLGGIWLAERNKPPA
jgi:drug/metabolite transporter (DMT)-like permease